MIDTGFILQALNGILAPVTVCCLLVFARYFYYNRHQTYQELRPVIAMMALCAADAILRIPVFFFQVRKNMDIDTTFEMEMSYIVGRCLALIAFLCVIRVFSPYRWGVWSWVVPLIASGFISLGSLAYVYWR